MKNKKKILGAICAAALVVGAIAFPLADEPNTAPKTTITVKEAGENGGVHEGSKYVAWRLFDVVITEKDGKTTYKYSISNTKYKDAIYKTIATMENSTEEETKKTYDTDSKLITWVSKLDETKIRVFADYMWQKLSMTSAGGQLYDAEAENGVFKDVLQGYYLIVETELNDTSNIYSLVMLDTAGNEALTVTTKREMVTIEKKVKEKDDSKGTTSEWQDAADYDVTDYIDFKLTGTIPETLRVDMLREEASPTSAFKYVFHDKECTGLTVDTASIVVTIDDKTIDAYNESTAQHGYKLVTSGLEDGCTFEIVFDDIIKSGADAGSTVVVNYRSQLNNSAVVGYVGNENEARIEFTNNLYGLNSSSESGVYSTSYTGWDKVKVFTYEININKVDGAGAALPGAGFTLYKKNSTNQYDVVKVIPPAESSAQAITKFVFSGLDAGEYKIVESTVPDGYNQAADIVFEITATYDTINDDPQLKTLSVPTENTAFTAEKTDEEENAKLTGKLVVTIENLTGKELPSTGGIGTTIFYAIGAILILGGSVLFIARKKTEKE